MEPYAYIDCSVRSSCCKNAILIAQHVSGTEVTCVSCSGSVDRATGQSLRYRGTLGWDGARLRAGIRENAARKVRSDKRFVREVLKRGTA